MNTRSKFALSVCLALAALAPAFAGNYTENFTSTPKADGTYANWTLPDSGFSVKSGMLTYDGTPDKNIAIWSATPIGSTVTYEADITPSDVPNTDWSVAGIGIYADDQNYWHLALVQAPDANQKSHSAELFEMYNGNWGAQSAQGSTLTSTNDVPGFDWKSGVTYHFKIVLTPTQIQGQILEGTVVRYSCTTQLSATAVTKGRPMLDDGGIKANFTNLSARITP